MSEAWKEMPEAWRGARLASREQFPILLKFIFPKDKLSVQVHPDDAYAAAHEQAAGGRGKTEMWHALSAEPGAQVLVGLKPGVDRRKFCDALDKHKIEGLFETYSVHARDTFFIPAGTPHTIGPGMVLCEVQEYSDLTYRVYDYGRADSSGKPRELHVRKALEVMRYGSTDGGKVRPVALEGTAPKRTLLAACRYFAAELWESSEPFEMNTGAEHFDLLTILAGHGKFAWPGDAVDYWSGTCWFKPATLERLSIRPNETTALLRAYVPDLAALRSALQRDGVCATAISNVVFDRHAWR